MEMASATQPQRLEIYLANLAQVREIVLRTAIHDVKGPLNAASLELDLLRQMAELEAAGAAPPGANPASRLESVIAVRQELRRIAELMDELTPLPDALVTSQERLDPCKLVQEAVRLSRHPAVLRNLRLDVILGENVAAVWGSGGPLMLAVLNLLLNAGEASSPGDQIRVSTANAGNRVQISIEDQGPGIAPEDRSLVFEPRFTRKTGHTGLGLPVAQSIATEHGGSVELNPGVDGGCVAVLSLPGAPEE